MFDGLFFTFDLNFGCFGFPLRDLNLDIQDWKTDGSGADSGWLAWTFMGLYLDLPPLRFSSLLSFSDFLAYFSFISDSAMAGWLRFWLQEGKGLTTGFQGWQQDSKTWKQARNWVVTSKLGR